VLLLGLLLVWLIQLMTHYNNEYCDLETGLVTDKPTRISGGSRVLPRRLVPRDTARIASVATLLLSVILAISLVLWMDVGILALAFTAIAIFLGWFYSAPPQLPAD
jgi:1,4-dihydroxy-2-naphthoate octaprenyltransferase